MEIFSGFAYYLLKNILYEGFKTVYRRILIK